MPYVRNKLTWGTERLYHVLKPLIPKDWNPKRGRYKQNEIDEIFKRVKKAARNRHSVGTLDVYNIYHRLIKPRIPELRQYDNRLITSQSVNRTEDDRLFGMAAYPAAMDPFANTAAFFDKMMSGLSKISNDWQRQHGEDAREYYEREVYHPVGPFFFPFRFRKAGRGIEMVHMFEESVRRTNDVMAGMDSKVRLGATSRLQGSNEPQYGSYEFSEMLFLKSAAKRARVGIYSGYGYDARFVERNLMFLPDGTREHFENFLEGYEFVKDKENILPRKEGKEFSKYYDEVLGKSTHVNRQMAWAALENSLYRPLGIEQAVLISMEGSYARQIIPEERAITWELMENKKFPKHKEAEDSAINRILGEVWNGWLEKRMRP
jgi:hypothetical protein